MLFGLLTGDSHLNFSWKVRLQLTTRSKRPEQVRNSYQWAAEVVSMFAQSKQHSKSS